MALKKLVLSTLVIAMLFVAPAVASANTKIALYYEKGTTRTASQMTSDLNYIYSHYANDPTYFHFNGKPLLAVYGDKTDTCTDVANMVNASAGRFYLMMKVFSNSSSCSKQPDLWHQYAPAIAVNQINSDSYNISPGFYQCHESTPRLTRSLSRFTGNIATMASSGVTAELVTSFNEWCEGTSVEPATEWSSSSGAGTFLDALHNGLPATAPAGTFRGIFYYPWYPETEGGATHYHPILGSGDSTPADYDSGDPAVIAQHAAWLNYGHMDVAIASWWGQGSATDSRIPALLSGFASSGGGAVPSQTEPATNVTSTSATLNGGDNCPSPNSCVAWFQYSTDNFATWTATTHLTYPNGYTPIAVNVSGLTPGTTYKVRLAEQDNGQPTVHYDSVGTPEGTAYDSFSTP